MLTMRCVHAAYESFLFKPPRTQVVPGEAMSAVVIASPLTVYEQSHACCSYAWHSAECNVCFFLNYKDT